MVRSAFRRAVVWGTAIALAAVVPAWAQDVARPSAKAKPAAAEKDASGDSSKKKDIGAALKAYDAGARAYEQGKMEPAIQSLTTALSSGGLPSQQMAKALYYRGAAYRKQGKPAQAISDLTTAVWLKNGLSDADRALAIDQRQGAYREAGLGDAPPVVAQQASAPATPVAAPAAGTAPPPPAITPGAQVSVPGNSSMFSWLDLSNFGIGSSPSPAPAPTATPAPAEPSPVAATSTATSSWSTTATAQSEAATAVTAAAPPPPSAPAPSFAPAAPMPVADPVAAPPPGEAAPQQLAMAESGDVGAVQGPNALEKAGSAITGFFGNMFKGSGDAGAQATSSSSSPVLTSATGSGGANAAPPTMDWGATTAVASKGEKHAALAAPPPAARAEAPGKYRLQVAAVRSRDEADQVASRVAVEQAAILGGRTASVDETVIGNMGTFYRVWVGPYADMAEPEKHCGALRPHGYDCLVVDD